METPHPKPSFFKRFVRGILFAAAALITLAALLLAEENWRGGWAWRSYKRAMEAKGERFDAARLIPPEVPDDENFAMTPLFAPIFTLPQGDPRQPMNLTNETQFGSRNEATNIDLERLLVHSVYDRPPHPLGWDYGMAADVSACAAAMQGTNERPVVHEGARQRNLRRQRKNPAPDLKTAPQTPLPDPVQAASVILDRMKPSEPTLAELYKSVARPHCRFNLHYEAWSKPENFSAMQEHFVLSKWLCRFLTMRAQAEMVAGRTDQALQDLNVMFRVEDGLKDEPLVISQLVCIAEMAFLMQSVGEGLAEHRWSEDQLRVLQERLRQSDLLASANRALYGERDLCCNPAFDARYLFMMPSGWNRLEQVNLNRTFQDAVLARINLAARVINPSINHSIDLALQRSPPETGWVSALLHHKIMAKVMVQDYTHFPQQAAHAQSEVDLAMLACALERYRLAHSEYPDDLQALVPSFVTVLPHDIINGQPLKYRRTADGRFILYSVGWNEKDDGGVVAPAKGHPDRQDILQGDWVWEYPQKD
jgi:hypothetical protein